MPTSKEIYKIQRKSTVKTVLKLDCGMGKNPRGYEFKMPDRIFKLVSKEKKCQCGGELIPEQQSRGYEFKIPDRIFKVVSK